MAAVTKEDVEAVLAESIEQRVTPYSQYEYQEQLKRKHTELKGILQTFNKNLDNDIRRNSEIAPNWYIKNKEMPLSDDIIHSDTLDGYRNKVEFTVGH